MNGVEAYGAIVAGVILALAMVGLALKRRTAELARVNDSLRQSEKRFRAFVSATSDVVYRMSADWREMYHLHGQDFIPDTHDPSTSWLDRYIPPDEQPLVTRTINEAIRTKKNFELEHRVRRVDGTIGWTFSRAIPLLDAQGRILEWFGAATDVTERKQADVKLQAQLTRLNLLGQITRAIGEHQDTNRIFQVVTRALEEHLAVDFCCICLYDEAAGQLTVASVGSRSAALASELGLCEQAHIEIDANGLSRCVGGKLVYEPDVRTVPFPFPRRLAGGGLCALVAAPLLVEPPVSGILVAARREANSFSSGDCEFLRQASEHVALAAHQAQLHGALQRAYDDLRQTQQAILQQERLLALGKMASGIAHDINNAISPIALYTDVLLERATELTPKTRHQVEIIRRAIDDVAQTVARLREFYRAREAQQTATPVDLNRLVPQVIDLTRARWSDMAQRRGVVIGVHTELAPDLPAILGIEGELRDALTNLIFNAVDAMPAGGELTVRTLVKEPGVMPADGAAGAASIQLEVADTGVGMDEETLRRCLEPFFTTKGERGTGLGLALVYGTLQRHGGDIDIQSSLGKGTSVRLSFAIPKVAGSETPVMATAAAATEPLHILLIDDDPLVLQSMRDTLEKEGHRVTLADGGQAGIDAFRGAIDAGEPMPVVITDLGMPYVDGRAVSRAIKLAAPATRVVLLTGWGQRLAEDGDIPQHVDRVLSKPPRLRELRAALTPS